MIRGGVPQSIAKRVTGHRSDSMFQRYDIASTADKLEALQKARAYAATRAAVGENVTRFPFGTGNATDTRVENAGVSEGIWLAIVDTFRTDNVVLTCLDGQRVGQNVDSSSSILLRIRGSGTPQTSGSINRMKRSRHLSYTCNGVYFPLISRDSWSCRGVIFVLSTASTTAAMARSHVRHITLTAALVGLASAVFAADPIAIGVSITQSPPGSVVQGTQVKDGLEIAKDMINAMGGALGRPIQLIYEDNQGIPEKGRAAAEKLISKDKVVALTGGHQSSVCLAEIEVAHRYGVPYINTNCWSDDVRKKGYPEVFNPGNYNTHVSDAMAETIKALGVKSVVAFAENTDYGIGQAKLIAEFLKQRAPNVQYRFETLDRASKDFTPAVIALRASPPDMAINIMLPPAGYILMNQLYEQGIAPGPKTWLYDGTGLADYPDFWQNVKDAGKYLVSFGLYHPKMDIPPLGRQVAAEYTKRTKLEVNRLIFQAADSLLLIVDAIKEAKSTDPKAIESALQKMKFTGARGTFQFSDKPGYTFQQWVDIPYVNYQFTAVNQKVSDANLIQGPGQPLDVKKLQKPK